VIITHIFALAIVQGLTEFLPVSSSGHLVLLSKFAGWPDQGQTIDVAIHIGSLLAVIIYFIKDISSMGKDLGKSYFLPSNKYPLSKLFWLIVLATLPIVIIGYFVAKSNANWLRSSEIIGWSILIFGIILYIADKVGMTIRKTKHLDITDALVIGFSQCLALIPGTSRSGITMTAARFLGMERCEAAKFSMLLSIPTIIGAGVLLGYEIYQSGNIIFTHSIIAAIIYSFTASIISIYAMMWWLKNSSFTPFVVYRIILGIILILISKNLI
jgi:undecaprenyl-diphosphatase